MEIPAQTSFRRGKSSPLHHDAVRMGPAKGMSMAWGQPVPSAHRDTTHIALQDTYLQDTYEPLCDLKTCLIIGEKTSKKSDY